MASDAMGRSAAWMAGRVVLAYALGGVVVLASAGALKVFHGGAWAERVSAVAPAPNAPNAERVNKRKIRDALAGLPPILARIGVALLAVAALGRLVRSIEPAEPQPPEPGPTRGRDDARGRRPRPLADRLVPLALAALVLAQVGPPMGRPHRGDELENYDQHLKLPLGGTLTTMGGANNQLGFSVLAWASIRAFGDSPASVRLPALVGAMLLPVVAYRYASKRFGRGGATALGLALALWPDCVMAGMQGRSYSLLMLAAVAHFHFFERFVTRADRRSGFWFAATLAAACTLHLWFVILAGAELAFLALLKLDARSGRGIIGVRTPLRFDAFLVALTLGALGAAAAQAGLLPKFLFILTQKNPTPVGAGWILENMAECLGGLAFDNDGIEPGVRRTWAKGLLRPGLGLAMAAGLLASAWLARKDAAARFELAFFLVAASTFFLVVYAQKPVYLYARFFAVLPMILAWSGSRGWASILAQGAGQPVASASSTIPA